MQHSPLASLNCCLNPRPATGSVRAVLIEANKIMTSVAIKSVDESHFDLDDFDFLFKSSAAETSSQCFLMILIVFLFVQ